MFVHRELPLVELELVYEHRFDRNRSHPVFGDE